MQFQFAEQLNQFDGNRTYQHRIYMLLCLNITPCFFRLNEMSKISRNDPCPCNSGKKYKQCCLQTEGTRTVAHSVSSQVTAIETALGYHRAGQMSEAESIYRQIIDQNNGNADALHLLGLVLDATGRYAEAEEMIKRAIAASPHAPDFRMSMGSHFKQQGEMEKAVAYYKQALDLQSNHLAANVNLGITLMELKRLPEAQEYLQHAVKMNPDFPDAHNALGTVLKKQGKLDEAISCFQNALASKPDYIDCYHNLASTYEALGRGDLARQCYSNAITIMPNHPHIYCDLGMLLARQGDMSGAIQAFEKALSLNPNFYVAYYHLGDAFREMKQLNNAIQFYQKALSLFPNYAEAYCSLGAVLLSKGQLEEASVALQKAVLLKPGYAQAYNNLGAVLLAQGNAADALKYYELALQHQPDSAEMAFNKSVCLLLLGDFANGFALYQKRLQIEERKNDPLTVLTLSKVGHKPMWNGEPLNNQRLLVWTEQGMGDSLMMMRFLLKLPSLQPQKLHIYCDPALVSIMRSLPGVDEVTSHLDPLPPDSFDCHSPIMSLPHWLGSDEASISSICPYLPILDEKRAMWSSRLATHPGLKVGLVWAGRESLAKDALRSLDLTRFSTLMSVGGVQFISLQKGNAARQLTEVDWPVIDWMDECIDFMDTAALVANLDLVIAVDTAVAHLTGALGRPLWLLNRFESEWRWQLNRDDSPWYPTARIFRQSKPHDWDDVILRMKDELKKLSLR